MNVSTPIEIRWYREQIVERWRNYWIDNFEALFLSLLATGFTIEEASIILGVNASSLWKKVRYLGRQAREREYLAAAGAIDLGPGAYTVGIREGDREREKDDRVAVRGGLSALARKRKQGDRKTRNKHHVTTAANA